MSAVAWLLAALAGAAIMTNGHASIVKPPPGAATHPRAAAERGATGAREQPHAVVKSANEADEGPTGRAGALAPGERDEAPAMTALRRGLAVLRSGPHPGRYPQAAEQFERAAVTDAGQLALAYLLGWGLGVEPDEPRARELLLGARGAYRPRAWYLLGLLDERSRAPARNTRARTWFECAARAGDGLALNHLGILLEKEGRVREAAAMYRAAARQGVREGSDNAQRLQQAESERVSRADFARLRARAAAGDVEAMYTLGRAYHRGLGVPADYTEALRWYRLAASRGHAEARTMLNLILAWPLTPQSINPPWTYHLSENAPTERGGLAPIAGRRLPVAERDPLQGLETLHLRPSTSVQCELTP